MTQKKNMKHKNKKKAMAALRRRALAIALGHHISKIDARTFTSLQRISLFKNKDMDIGKEIDHNIIIQKTHPDKISLPPGPILVCKTNDKSGNVIVETQILLLSSRKEIRKAAVEYYDRLFEDNELQITPKTATVMLKNREGILSDNDSKWRTSAISIFDAINEDIYVLLAGVNQILKSPVDISQLLNKYAPRIMHPKMSSLDTITLKIRDPENEHDKIKAIINEAVANSKSISEASQKYYFHLGYLPLAREYSLAEVVSKWMESHPETNVWDEIWTWAENAFGPVPQYHACVVFSIYPDLVPEGKHIDLWNKILFVICVPEKADVNANTYEPWLIRKHLINHYTFHIESNLPNADGANIACFVWWFTEKLTSLFGKDPKVVSQYRKEWIDPSLDISSHMWLDASPAQKDSLTRYMSHIISSPWALSLLCMMGRYFDRLKPEELSVPMKKQFNDSLVTNLFMAMPFSMNNQANLTYAFQHSLRNTIIKWKKHQSEEVKKSFQQVLKTNIMMLGHNTFIEQFKKIHEKEYPDQIVLSSVLKSKVFSTPVIIEDIAKVISVSEWRELAFSKLHLNSIGIIVETLGVMQVKSTNPWVYEIPHYLADYCDKTPDEERRRDFFLFAMHACIASDSFSAVNKLLTGKNACNYTKYVEEYRKRIEGMKKYYPPWVVGRLRPLMTAMNIY